MPLRRATGRPVPFYLRTAGRPVLTYLSWQPTPDQADRARGSHRSYQDDETGSWWRPSDEQAAQHRARNRTLPNHYQPDYQRPHRS